jgi:SAM-dependent methyltransferase
MKQLARGFWRLSQPLRYIHGWRRLRLPKEYFWFLSQWRAFVAQGGSAPFEMLAPAFFDRDPSTQTGGGHYFFQDIWALKKLSQAKPTEHHDVGSRIDGFTGQATTICPIIYWDIRPPSFSLPGFSFRQGSVTSLPLADGSIASLSCLHTAEHIGLGRYGDPLDPLGTEKCLAELKRVLAPGGRLLFSMPVGRERTEFNSQRVWNPTHPPEIVAGLQLTEFSAVNDRGEFLENIQPQQVADQKYACGLYEFRAPESPR